MAFWRLVWTDHLYRRDRPTYPIKKGLLSDLANGPSGRGRGVLKKAGTGQRHGPTWSVANVRTDMVRNSEQCLYVQFPVLRASPIFQKNSGQIVNTFGIHTGKSCVAM